MDVEDQGSVYTWFRIIFFFTGLAVGLDILHPSKKKLLYF